MKSLKLAEKRSSVRAYKNKPLREEDINALNLLLAHPPKFPGAEAIDFFFLKDGLNQSQWLHNLAGYNGIMIEAPHYYVLLSEDSPEAFKAVGYTGEWFILNALKQGIGSCWLEIIDSDRVKSIAGIDSPKKAVAMIAVGYGQKEYQNSQFFSKTTKGSLFSLAEMGYPDINTDLLGKEPASYRKSITELIYMNEWGNAPAISDLEQMELHKALFYMRLAPSYENRQPWMFVSRGNHIDLAMKQFEGASPAVRAIDAGIAMLYMEVGLHDSGFPGEWHLSTEQPPADIPAGYDFEGQYIF